MNKSNIMNETFFLVDWVSIFISTLFISTVIAIPLITVIMTPTRGYQKQEPPFYYIYDIDYENEEEEINRVVDQTVDKIIQDAVKSMPIIST